MGQLIPEPRVHLYHPCALLRVSHGDGKNDRQVLLEPQKRPFLYHPSAFHLCLFASSRYFPSDDFFLLLFLTFVLFYLGRRVQSLKTDIAVNFTDGMFKGIYNAKQYHLADIATVLSRAWSSGVDRIIVTGGSLEESKEALAIAETDGRLFCTVGVHPTRSKEFEESGDPETHFQALLSLAKEGIQKGKVVAIGECGLDYDRLHFCPSDVQKKYFEKQFELAYETKLPMFLHMRAAAEDFREIVERNKDKFSAGVTHSFSGSAEDCDKLLSFSSMYIGVNGCSLKTTENLNVVRGIPVERMMIETDSPYCEVKNTHAGINFVKSLWPSKKKEKYSEDSVVKGRNEPCFVRQVLEVVAGCKGISDIDQIGRTIYHNTCRVFFPQDLDSAADALLACHCDSH